MRVAVGQFREVSKSDLTFARQMGASGVLYNSLDLDDTSIRHQLGLGTRLQGDVRNYYDYDDLVRLREVIEAAGMRLEALENVPARAMREIKLATPERDRQLDDYCRTIENMGRAGIKVLGYNFMITPVARTDRANPGRGGAACTAYDHAIGATWPDLLEEPITHEQVWERWTTFVDRVVPVAESAGVTLALHPDDPPVPMLQGVGRIFGNVGNFARALEHTNSPHHGLDFCMGSFAEAGVEVMYEALERFGAMGRIVYVHFRNVQGRLPSFTESFVDDGDFDVVRAVTTLRRQGFKGFIIDDHVPHMVDDTRWGHRGRAYATGYIKGLVRATEPLAAAA